MSTNQFTLTIFLWFFQFWLVLHQSNLVLEYLASLFVGLHLAERTFIIVQLARPFSVSSITKLLFLDHIFIFSLISWHSHFLVWYFLFLMWSLVPILCLYHSINLLAFIIRLWSLIYWFFSFVSLLFHVFSKVLVFHRSVLSFKLMHRLQFP